MCHGRKWVKENQERGKNIRYRWKDNVCGRAPPQRVVDVGKVRTLIWCKRCSGWASESKLGKRLRDVVNLEARGWPVSSEVWTRAIGCGETGTWQERGVSVCKEGTYRPPRVNFRVSVT